MTPDLNKLFQLIDTSWPAVSYQTIGPWLIREGKGGGSRVSAATAHAAFSATDIETAETAMRSLGQTPLFMVRTIDSGLDEMLAERGYAVKDPVTVYVIPNNDLASEKPPYARTFSTWPPLSITQEIWAEGGIDAARIGIMERVNPTKTSILGRLGAAPAGAAFVAIENGIAMLHSLEVRKRHRRNGVGIHIMREAGRWAQIQGAEWFSLLTTDENLPSNALYTSLGFKAVGHYHYRIKI